MSIKITLLRCSDKRKRITELLELTVKDSITIVKTWHDKKLKIY